MRVETLVIGSRASRLALAQAAEVKDKLKLSFPGLDISIKTIKTTGDKVTGVALDKIGEQGLFTKEIEDALLAGSIDIAVHSMKDLPTEIPDGLAIAAVTQREDPRDILVSPQGHNIKSLPAKARVGTSSLRRRAQVLHLRPDLECLDLRGNVETRVRKLNEGLYDAIVLAYAGVKRLGLKLPISVIPLEEVLPQVGQGALAVEIRQDRPELAKVLKVLDHADTHLCIDAERAVLSGLGGGCHAPIGVYAKIEGDKIIIEAGVFSLDGKEAIKDRISGAKNEAQKLASTLVDKIQWYIW